MMEAADSDRRRPRPRVAARTQAAADADLARWLLETGRGADGHRAAEGIDAGGPTDADDDTQSAPGGGA
jgi:hypothetical protein